MKIFFYSRLFKFIKKINQSLCQEQTVLLAQGIRVGLFVKASAPPTSKHNSPSHPPAQGGGYSKTISNKLSLLLKIIPNKQEIDGLFLYITVDNLFHRHIRHTLNLKENRD